MKKSLIVLPVLAASLIGAGYAGGSILIPDLPEASATETSEEEGHPAADTAAHGPNKDAHDDTHKSSSDEKDPYELAEDPKLVRVGQITVPVYKPSSVSYVVAEIAIQASDPEMASRITRVETAVRARDILVAGMHSIAEGPLLRGVTIDSEALSQQLTKKLRVEFPAIEGIIFVSLFKQDVPRI